MRVAHSWTPNLKKGSKFVNKLTRAESPEKGKRCSSELDIYRAYSTYT